MKTLGRDGEVDPAPGLPHAAEAILHCSIFATEATGGVSRRAKCYRTKIRRAKTPVTETSVSKEGTGVGPEAQREYLARMRERYVGATRREKGRLLDEAVAVTGRHRKALIRCWRRDRPSRRRRGGRPTRYGPAVVRALSAIWIAAGYPWSVRLKALLPTWVPWARRRLALTPATETGHPVEAPHSAEDRSLGRDRARLHGD